MLIARNCLRIVSESITYKKHMESEQAGLVILIGLI